MNESLQNRFLKITKLISETKQLEHELDELFFSKPTVSVLPPPIQFFNTYYEDALNEVSQAKTATSKTESYQIKYPKNFGQLIGEKIKNRRVELDLTQSKLAELTNIRRPNIARLEKGESLPNLSTLIKISEALKITLENILKI